MDSSKLDSFWGPQTSYLNFCEEDYVITRYVAEFINTLSSSIYCVFGLYGLFQLRQKTRLSFARSIPYLGLIGVGVCSGGYHMTLKYHTQMSDELSMHLLTTPLLYRILSFQKPPQETKLIGTVLGTLFAIVMLVHMVMDEFLLHAVSFGAAVLLITTKTMKTIPARIPDLYIRANIKLVSRFGVFSFIFGYTVWLIDTWFCPNLTAVRNTLGLPLAFLFEFHGWWHVFTGIGGYVAVFIVDFITSDEVDHDPIRDMAFPLPLVARVLGASGSTAIGGGKEK
ncbi:ceramidase [Aspergillus californicus]